jgi:hypothetical protein
LPHQLELVTLCENSIWLGPGVYDDTDTLDRYVRHWQGAPLALVAQRWIGVAVLVLSLKVTGNHKSTWFGWKFSEALSWSGMVQFLKLGLPSCMGLLAEMLG